MSETKIAPSIEGWYTTGENPELLGTRCKWCGSYFFPKQETFCRNPSCRSTEFEETPLSREGTIWSYTEHFYSPPEPYIFTEPFEPYIIVAVELEKEKMIVLGQAAQGVKSEELSTGQKVELVVEPLYEQEGTQYTVWKWTPVAG